MCSRDFSAVLSQASVTFSISDLSRTSRSLFMGLNRPERETMEFSCFLAQFRPTLGENALQEQTNSIPVCLVCLCELTSNVPFVAVVNLF